LEEVRPAMTAFNWEVVVGPSSLLLEVSTGSPTCSNRGASEELKLIVVSVGGGETRHIHVVSAGRCTI
jgi:hypothetical protein